MQYLELLPDFNSREVLYNIHQIITPILKNDALICNNSHDTDYHPHLTLLAINREQKFKIHIYNSLNKFCDYQFILLESDQFWQTIKIAAN